jgi:hypothetical protein
MINGKKIAVGKPAYNTEKTLEKTVRELLGVVDIELLVATASTIGNAFLGDLSHDCVAIPTTSIYSTTRGQRP